MNLLFLLLLTISSTNYEVTLNFVKETKSISICKCSLKKFKYFDFIYQNDYTSEHNIEISFTTSKFLLDCISIIENEHLADDLFVSPQLMMEYFELFEILRIRNPNEIIFKIVNLTIYKRLDTSFILHVLKNIVEYIKNSRQTTIFYVFASLHTCFKDNNFMLITKKQHIIFGNRNKNSYLEITCNSKYFKIIVDLESEENITKTRKIVDFRSYLKNIEIYIISFILCSQIKNDIQIRSFEISFLNSSSETHLDSNTINYFLESSLFSTIKEKLVFFSFGGCSIDTKGLRLLANYKNITNYVFNNCILSDNTLITLINYYEKNTSLETIILTSIHSLDPISKSRLFRPNIYRFVINGINFNTSLSKIRFKIGSNLVILSLLIDEDFDLIKLKSLTSMKKLKNLYLVLSCSDTYTNLLIVLAINDVLPQLKIYNFAIECRFGVFKSSWFQTISHLNLNELSIIGCIIDSFPLELSKTCALKIFISFLIYNFARKISSHFKIETFSFDFSGNSNVFDQIFSSIEFNGFIFLDFKMEPNFIMNSRYNLKNCDRIKIENITEKGLNFAFAFLKNCDFEKLETFSVLECFGFKYIFSLFTHLKFKKICIKTQKQNLPCDFLLNGHDLPLFTSLIRLEICNPIPLCKKQIESIVRCINLKTLVILGHKTKFEYIENIKMFKELILRLKYVDLICDRNLYIMQNTIKHMD